MGNIKMDENPVETVKADGLIYLSIVFFFFFRLEQ